MVQTTSKVKIERFCAHCLCEWEQFVSREDLDRLAAGEAISICPNPACGLPT